MPTDFHQMPILRPAIDAPRSMIETAAGQVAVYSDGAGPPVLLIHSVNAAAASHEMRAIFDHLAPTRRVYAMDLPGFGASERQARRHDIPTYVEAIEDVALDILRQSRCHQLDIVALSLTAEFVARLARSTEDLVRSLTLITPTGFQVGAHQLRGPIGRDKRLPGVEAALSLPVLGDALFKGLTSRASIRFFLERTFGGPDVPEAMVDYAYETAHQPNAKHAVWAFASGKLFSKDIRTVYEDLRCPVWLAHGTKGAFADFTDADWVLARPNWRKTAYPTGAMPHVQRPELFLPDLTRFLDQSARRVARPAPNDLYLVG